MKTKLLIAFSTLGIVAFLGGVAFALQPKETVENTEAQPVVATEIVEEVAVTEEVIPVEVPKEEVAPEPVKVVKAPVVVPAAVKCDNNIPCFTNAVTAKKNAHYWGEASMEMSPGVSIWTAQVWDFKITTGSTAYTFTTSASDMKVLFADDWFDQLLAGGMVPAEVQAEIDNAKYLTEEELSTMSAEERAYYDKLIATGKTPQEIAKEQAKYSMENYIQSTVAGSGAGKTATRTCTSSDLPKLIATLKDWEQKNYSTSDLDFASCQTTTK